MALSTTLSTAEIELYRLLEKANLLQYFPNFLAKGGDDVTQLSEASKEEFDEIIEMIGMKQRPLHIRRLQKTLKDYSNKREMLMEPGPPIKVPEPALPYLRINQSYLTPPRPKMPKLENDAMKEELNIASNAFLNSPLFNMNDGTDSPNTNLMGIFNNALFPGYNPNNGNSNNSNDTSNNTAAAAAAVSAFFNNTNRLKPLLEKASPNSLNNSTPTHNVGIPVSLLPNAVLSETEKDKIRMAAENLAITLPKIDARTTSSGRKDVNKGVLVGICNVLMMDKNDPERRNEIYKYSAIYGRFNAIRRTGKPMNHHEVSVNEAAAQLCLQIPELITRRDNLFHLARQVVKMAEEIQTTDINNYTFSKNSVSMVPNEQKNNNCNCSMLKQIELVRQEIETLLEQERQIRDNYRDAKLANQTLLMNDLQKRLDDILSQLNNKFTEQTSLATKQMFVSKRNDGCKACKNCNNNKNDFDNESSNNSSSQIDPNTPMSYNNPNMNMYSNNIIMMSNTNAPLSSLHNIPALTKPNFPEPEYTRNSNPNFIIPKTEPILSSVSTPPQSSSTQSSQYMSTTQNSFITNVYHEDLNNHQITNQNGQIEFSGSNSESLDDDTNSSSIIESNLKNDVYPHC